MKRIHFSIILIASKILSTGCWANNDFEYSPEGSYKIERFGIPSLDFIETSSEPAQKAVEKDFPIFTSFEEPQKINEPATKTTSEKPVASKELKQIVAQSPAEVVPPQKETPKHVSINFPNVSMLEVVRYIGQITDKNFIYNEGDLQFNVSIVSKEPTSVENVIAAVMQELRIRNLSLIEIGNTIIIHKNPNVKSPSKIIVGNSDAISSDSAIVTRVFRLNTLDPEKTGDIIRPMLSQEALVSVLKDTNNLIITDLTANVNKIAELISNLDAPKSGMTIGQYVVKNTYGDSLLELAEQILTPIAQGNPFTLVPHIGTNSIYIVSNPFLVEKALSILQQLDLNDGNTKILTLSGLKYEENLDGQLGPGRYPPGAFPPGTFPGTIPPEEMPGYVPPEVPIPPEVVRPGGISVAPPWTQEPPPGRLERTLFYIHKLKYRRGDQIELALRKIADTLMINRSSNIDLIDAINSTQWIESSNSLIFAGTQPVLDRIRALIDEVDIPLRQVYIEMLILDTTIDDSLQFGVSWRDNFGGGNVAGGEGFLEPLPPINPLIPGVNATSAAGAPVPDGRVLNQAQNLFQWGIIGRHLTFCGMEFNTIAALVTAVHQDTKSNIVLSPKIITEDNHTAEIFVGSTDLYKTQSISNDDGTVLTNNYQLIDLGTLLRITPMIGNDGLITIDLIQESTEAFPNSQFAPPDPVASAVVLSPLFSKARTTTRVHVPDGYFVIISGQIRDIESESTSRIPCFGGLPLLGSLGKTKSNGTEKRNLMIFMRPQLVDTDEDLEILTRRQQDIFREKSKNKRRWNFEVDETLDFLNIKPTDPNERKCVLK